MTDTVTFIACQGHPGREIAFHGETIVGDIIPNAGKRGGWIWHFAKDIVQGRMPQPEFVRSRTEGRDKIRIYEGAR